LSTDIQCISALPELPGWLADGVADCGFFMAAVPRAVMFGEIGVLQMARVYYGS
jgi:hypothetical protein